MLAKSHYFTCGGVRLHYWQWGQRDKPLLVLQHGGKDHARSMELLLARLSGDWCVVAPDLRGHGDSAWSTEGNYALNTLLQDFVGLVEHLQPQQAINLCGHSLGGNVVTRYAALFPDRVRRLVNIEGLGLPPSAWPERAEQSPGERLREYLKRRALLQARPHRAYVSLTVAAERLGHFNPSLSDSQLAHLTEHGMRENDDGSWSWKFDPLVGAWNPSDFLPTQIAEWWREITCPVFLAYGADSWASDPTKDGRVTYFADVKARLYEGAGHWVHLDQLDDFTDDLNRFLRD